MSAGIEVLAHDALERGRSRSLGHVFDTPPEDPLDDLLVIALDAGEKMQFALQAHDVRIWCQEAIEPRIQQPGCGVETLE